VLGFPRALVLHFQKSAQPPPPPAFDSLLEKSLVEHLNLARAAELPLVPSRTAAATSAVVSRATSSGGSQTPHHGIPGDSAVSRLLAFLDTHGLGVYAEALLSNGYDDLSIILNMSNEDFQDMCDFTQVLPGHRLKFIAAIEEGRLLGN